jgi:hypothetical protein
LSGRFLIHRIGSIPVSVLTIVFAATIVFPFYISAVQTQPTQSGVDKEIIQVSNMAKKIAEFSIKRDIFSPDVMVPQIQKNSLPAPRVIQPPSRKELDNQGREEVVERNVEAETRRSVTFEGYVIRNSQSNALIKVNGEYIIVGVGDVVLEKMKITKINKKAITVEADAKSFEIQLKGDNENE